MLCRIALKPCGIMLYGSGEPACHAGDHGFKSRRGRFDRHGAVRKPAKRPSSNLGDCGFNSRLRHWKTCVGWASASPTACKAAALGMCRFNSCPAHWQHGPFVYRFRMPAPHAGEAGSIPARAAEHDQVAQLEDARRSERRARIRGGLGVQLSPWSLKHCRRGRCPTGFHKAGVPGSIPGPATRGWARLNRAS